MTRCPDCAVEPGHEHEDGCDVARCLQTGHQRLMCGETHDCGKDRWTTESANWIGIARDDRTGHYWHSVPDNHLPACSRCGRWMTDWSLINACRPASPPLIRGQLLRTDEMLRRPSFDPPSTAAEPRSHLGEPSVHTCASTGCERPAALPKDFCCDRCEGDVHRHRGAVHAHWCLP